jgi:hypothetical protein
MKTLKLVVIVISLFLASAVQAQVSVSVNIGSPPPWGPYGYSGVRFYYLPDMEAYYDVQSSMFIYFEGGTWVHRGYLPARYRDYDLYGGYKVVMSDYHGNTPYMYFKDHRSKYARGYHGKAQRTIGERPGKGNSGKKISHEGNHDNKGDIKNAEHGKDKGDSHGNGKNMKENHGNGGEKGKKK